MHDAFFRTPVVVQTPNGEVRTLSSVSEAALFMMERWPDLRGPSYRDALQACTGRLSTADEIEITRLKFLAAASEAGLSSTGVQVAEPRRSVEQPKSQYVSDEKRRDRGEREEEDDFLFRFLARETGITELQARDLIKLIGNDRSSLLREARMLKAQR
ncbi:DUF982 domain-containing protein [Mesorhizobium loti]|nr:DUF982 domain-containing protein [Mesorhizobium loti]